MRHLILILDAPLMYLGAAPLAGTPARRADSPPRRSGMGLARFPTTAMLSGMIGAAIGIPRGDAAMGALQDALVHASAIVRGGSPLHDYQTARLGADDAAWTTKGRPDRRRGATDTYVHPHVMDTTYWQDASVTVAVRLRDSSPWPLDDVAAALREPHWPVYIGRKSCPPAGPLIAGEVDAPTSHAAVVAAAPGAIAYRWPIGDGPDGPVITLTGDRRDGPVHAGETRAHVAMPPGMALSY